MQIINQNSYLLGSAVALFLVGFLIFRKGVSPQGFLLFIGFGAVLTGVWLLFRPEEGVDLTIGEVQALIRGDTPVLIEFQSPY